jgi:hypothetical protein
MAANGVECVRRTRRIESARRDPPVTPRPVQAHRNQQHPGGQTHHRFADMVESSVHDELVCNTSDADAISASVLARSLALSSWAPRGLTRTNMTRPRSSAARGTTRARTCRRTRLRTTAGPTTRGMAKARRRGSSLDLWSTTAESPTERTTVPERCRSWNVRRVRALHTALVTAGTSRSGRQPGATLAAPRSDDGTTGAR